MPAIVFVRALKIIGQPTNAVVTVVCLCQVFVPPSCPEGVEIGEEEKINLKQTEDTNISQTSDGRLIDFHPVMFYHHRP